jgi:hypothetical protein
MVIHLLYYLRIDVMLIKDSDAHSGLWRAAMKHFLFTASSIALLTLLAGLGQAQSQLQSNPFRPSYDRTTETTIKGIVQELKANLSAPLGEKLTVESDGKAIVVHVGKAVGIANRVSVGDSIDITGSLVNVRGTALLLARQIKTSDGTRITLRNDRGYLLSSPVVSSSLQSGRRIP